jgi:hypothetical protein
MNVMKRMVLAGAVVALIMSFATPAMAQDDSGYFSFPPSNDVSCTQDLTGAYNPFGPYAVWHYQEVFGMQFPVLDYYPDCGPININ